LWHIFAAKFIGAFICRIGNSNNLDLRMLLESGQMPSPNNVARSDNADPQFVIIFVHWCDINVANSNRLFVRAYLDSEEQWRVQPITDRRWLMSPSLL
jgi:hypothetical protein